MTFRGVTLSISLFPPVVGIVGDVIVDVDGCIGLHDYVIALPVSVDDAVGYVRKVAAVILAAVNLDGAAGELQPAIIDIFCRECHIISLLF